MVKYLVGNVKGQDGFSPSAKVEQSGNTATITITDASGTTTATITGGGGGPIVEEDPIFSASPASTITAEDIQEWNEKSDFSGDYEDLTNKPDLSEFATTDDLDDKQDKLTAGANITIENNVISATGGGSGTTYTAGEGINISGTEISVDEQVVALKSELFSGDYDDLTNKPTIPTVPTNVSAFTNDAGYITSYTETDPVFTASPAHSITVSDISSWNNKQDALTAGNNIQINNGTISATDTTYTAGTGISIQNNVISATGGGGSSYTAGANIDITNDEISVTDTVELTDDYGRLDNTNTINGHEVLLESEDSGNPAYRTKLDSSSLTVEDRGDYDNIIVSPTNISLTGGRSGDTMSISTDGINLYNAQEDTQATIGWSSSGNLGISYDGGTTFDDIPLGSIPTADGTTIIDNNGVWSAVGGGGSSDVYQLAGITSADCQLLTTEIQTNGLPKFIQYNGNVYSQGWKDYTSETRCNYLCPTGAISLNKIIVRMNSAETTVNAIETQYVGTTAGTGISLNGDYYGNYTVGVDSSVVALKSNVNSNYVIPYSRWIGDSLTSEDWSALTAYKNNPAQNTVIIDDVSNNNIYYKSIGVKPSSGNNYEFAFIGYKNNGYYPYELAEKYELMEPVVIGATVSLGVEISSFWVNEGIDANGLKIMYPYGTSTMPSGNDVSTVLDEFTYITNNYAKLTDIPVSDIRVITATGNLLSKTSFSADDIIYIRNCAVNGYNNYPFIVKHTEYVYYPYYSYSSNLATYVKIFTITEFGILVYKISFDSTTATEIDSVESSRINGGTIWSGFTTTDASDAPSGVAYKTIKEELAYIKDNYSYPTIASGDAGKVLAVNSNADGVEWTTAGGGGSSYTAGDGISIDANNVISKDVAPTPFFILLSFILTGTETGQYSQGNSILTMANNTASLSKSNVATHIANLKNYGMTITQDGTNTTLIPAIVEAIGDDKTAMMYYINMNSNMPSQYTYQASVSQAMPNDYMTWGLNNDPTLIIFNKNIPYSSSGYGRWIIIKQPYKFFQNHYFNSQQGLTAHSIAAAIDELAQKKQNTLTAGEGIDITENVISAYNLTNMDYPANMIYMLDSATGDRYEITIENGEFVKTLVE